MTHTRKNTGVCSKSTTITIENGAIAHIQLDGGCEGNLSGICALLRGRDAKESAAALKGIRCEEKQTSCPDQIALCIEEALLVGSR